MFGSTAALAFGFAALHSVSALLVPSNSSEAVNSTIGYYTDSVLTAVAANPPKVATTAAVNFTNGPRKLPGATFHFTELAGANEVNLTTTEIVFSFPSGLSSTNNVFAYHIHQNPITPGDLNCSSAGAHYDPFKPSPNATYNPLPTNFSTYEIGDLSGKWGALSTKTGSIAPRQIFEHYVRLTGNYSVLGRSVVVHDAPTNTRIACGNITLSAH